MYIWPGLSANVCLCLGVLFWRAWNLHTNIDIIIYYGASRYYLRRYRSRTITLGNPVILKWKKQGLKETKQDSKEVLLSSILKDRGYNCYNPRWIDVSCVRYEQKYIWNLYLHILQIKSIIMLAVAVVLPFSFSLVGLQVSNIHISSHFWAQIIRTFFYICVNFYKSSYIHAD